MTNWRAEDPVVFQEYCVAVDGGEKVCVTCFQYARVRRNGRTIFLTCKMRPIVKDWLPTKVGWAGRFRRRSKGCRWYEGEE